MKTLIFLIFLVGIYSCKETSYQHKYTYSIDVTYSNGQRDTLNGVFVIANSSDSKCDFNIRLTNKGCVGIGDYFFEKQLACDVRKFELIEENILTTKNN